MSCPPFEKIITFNKTTTPTTIELQFILQSGKDYMFIRNLLTKKVVIFKIDYYNN